MHYVIFGAGAIGGVVAVRLANAGKDVAVVARGEHAAAIERSGLELRTPDETVRADLPVYTNPSALPIDAATVVLLAVKSQHTDDALDALCPVLRPDTPVVCLQNGVENERRVARRHGQVYAAVVMCPAAHLVPGVVEAYSSPVTGLIDLGGYPHGTDRITAQVTAALQHAGFDARERTDVMRWKYTKLLLNLVNAVDALCPPSDASKQLVAELRAEGHAVLDAAGIAYATDDDDRDRRGDLLTPRPIGAGSRSGASSWQSLERGTGSIETDYLNGEIALLGRLHGVPTPVNDAIQRVAADAARNRSEPGSFDAADILALARER